MPKAVTASRIVTRGFAVDQDGVDRLKQHGVRTIYCAADGETLDKFTLRKGETMSVVDGLRTFGKTRKEIHAAIKLVHSWGATIVDVERNENSRDHCFEMLDRALNHRPLSSDRAAELAELSHAARRAAKWPKDRAKRAWHNPDVKTIKAFVRLTDWPQSSAYAEFGPRFKPRTD